MKRAVVRHIDETFYSEIEPYSMRCSEPTLDGLTLQGFQLPDLSSLAAWLCLRSKPFMCFVSVATFFCGLRGFKSIRSCIVRADFYFLAHIDQCSVS